MLLTVDAEIGREALSQGTWKHVLIFKKKKKKRKPFNFSGFRFLLVNIWNFFVICDDNNAIKALESLKIHVFTSCIYCLNIFEYLPCLKTFKPVALGVVYTVVEFVLFHVFLTSHPHLSVLTFLLAVCLHRYGI